MRILSSAQFFSIWSIICCSTVYGGDRFTGAVEGSCMGTCPGGTGSRTQGSSKAGKVEALGMILNSLNSTSGSATPEPSSVQGQSNSENNVKPAKPWSMWNGPEAPMVGSGKVTAETDTGGYTTDDDARKQAKATKSIAAENNPFVYDKAVDGCVAIIRAPQFSTGKAIQNSCAFSVRVILCDSYGPMTKCSRQHTGSMTLGAGQAEYVLAEATNFQYIVCRDPFYVTPSKVTWSGGRFHGACMASRDAVRRM